MLKPNIPIVNNLLSYYVRRTQNRKKNLSIIFAELAVAENILKKR